MKLTRREALEIEDAWQGVFGKFLREILSDHYKSASEDGVLSTPASQYESIEREQIFGKAKAFKELLETIIPHEVEKAVIQTQDQADE